MPHKVYQVHEGTMRRGWAPDGTHIAILARDADGRDLSPIVAIDWGAKRLRRQGEEDWSSFPIEWYKSNQIIWGPGRASIHDYASQD